MNLFQVLSYLLIVLSVVSLLLSEIVSLPVFLLVLILIGVSFFRESLGLEISHRTLNLVALITGMTLLWSALTSFDSPLRQLLYFSLVLLIAKLFSAKAYRDHLQIFLISSFYLIAATLKLARLSYLLLFILFQALGIAYLILLNLRRDSQWCASSHALSNLKASGDYDCPGEIWKEFRLPLYLRIFACFLITVILSAAGFFLIPRFTWRFIGTGTELVELSTGFAESVDLGDLGEIKYNHTPVMKVFVEPPIPPIRLGLRWRGITLDEFDGSSWRVSRALRELERFEFPDGYYSSTFRLTRDVEPNFIQRFELQPLNTRMVFIQPEVVRLQLEEVRSSNPMPQPEIYSLRRGELSGNLFFSSVDETRYQAEQQRLQALQDSPRLSNAVRRRRYMDMTGGFNRPVAYRLESHVRSPSADLLRLSEGEDPEDIQEHYLQLPPGMRRIAELAREVVAQETTRYDQAAVIEAYLRRNFLYSLLPDPDMRGMNLEQFLFEVKKGHCEYYAAAMGVMLRTLHIPARVVNGFVSNEYNRFGKYFQVRQSDAHSWVEVYFPDYGWIPFDPTPPQTDQRFQLVRTMRQIFDLLESSWVKYVVDFSIHDQRQVLGVFFSLLRPKGEGEGLLYSLRLFDDSERGGMQPLLFLPVLTGVALLAVWVIRRIFRRRYIAKVVSLDAQANRDMRSAIAFYEQLLRILSRKGLKRRAGQTPGEFAESVALTHPALGDSVRWLTNTYYAIRFGGELLSADLRQRIQEQLKSLRNSHSLRNPAP